MDTRAALSGRCVLITGAHGFLGCHAAVAARRAGARVVGADLAAGAERGGRVRASLGWDGLAVREADLSDPVGWTRLLEGERPEVILHLAGAIGREGGAIEWGRCFAGNVQTTQALLTGLSSLPPEARPVLVYPGSQMEYGTAPMPWTEEIRCRPANPYAASKLLATELVLFARRQGLCRAVAARFPIVYGPGQPPSLFIPELICAALAGQPFRMTQGRQRRRFTFVEDAAGLLLQLGAGLLGGRALPSLINAPAAPPLSMREVAEAVLSRLGWAAFLEIGALPDRPGETLEAWPDDSLAASLGFSCSRGLEEGVARTAEWYRSNDWFWRGAAA